MLDIGWIKFFQFSVSINFNNIMKTAGTHGNLIFVNMIIYGNLIPIPFFAARRFIYFFYVVCQPFPIFIVPIRETRSEEHTSELQSPWN